jgi:hypothetical protein
MDVFDILFNVGMVILCIVSAGLASGLTMGMVSLDPQKLEIRKMIGA